MMECVLTYLYFKNALFLDKVTGQIHKYKNRNEKY